ncbi:substrate-binding domain-containing protein, partial [uncultured Dietzia sp.]|uniref:substrate-binding domain-containing protein n=1 Tax=uncultured Dietzia sp. TaxID=395519 RepID=UPI0025DB83FA
MRQRPVLAALTAVLACSGAAACASGGVEEEAVTIGVAAAPSLSAAFTEIISVFEADNPGVRVSIELGRSNEIAKSLGSRSDINVFAS